MPEVPNMPAWIRVLKWLGIGEAELICEACGEPVEPNNAVRHAEWHALIEHGDTEEN